MQHRHLLPNEIDLLLDGEIGFNVTPLRTHADDCPDCEARLARARVIVDRLEHLPHFVPNARFADRVIQQVHIMEPWHVAALDAARRLIPRSRSMRVLMGATASAAAVLISGSAVWLALPSGPMLRCMHFISRLIARAVHCSPGWATSSVIYSDNPHSMPCVPAASPASPWARA